jgi:hypothetical protein
MSWKKLGLIFKPDQSIDWMQSHATTPVPIHLTGDEFRIFFSSRNSEFQNQLGHIDINLSDLSTLKEVSKQPSLELGCLGHFDCDGLYGTSIIKRGEKLLLYYAGWNAGLRGLFYSSIGMAESDDMGKTFKRIYKGPVLTRDEVDPWAVMAPFVIEDSDHWKMYYTSGIKLYKEAGVLKSLYDIKLAVSEDGYKWGKTGQTCIPLTGEMTNIARANVIKSGSEYIAWFPYVDRINNQYRIGYGTSKNGVEFDSFKYDADLTVSDDESWDSEAVTYPYVFSHNEKEYMLYNGNGFGKTGFGLAVKENE